jgi:hypothetical protein
MLSKKTNLGSGWNRGISGLNSQNKAMMSFNKKYLGQYDNTKKPGNLVGIILWTLAFISLIIIITIILYKYAHFDNPELKNDFSQKEIIITLHPL